MNSRDDRLAALVRRRRGSVASPRGLAYVKDFRDASAWRPALIEAQVPGLDLLSWVSDHLDQVRELLADRGAVSLRGMSTTTEAFGAVVAVVAGESLIDYVNRSTPRTRVLGQVFTSTEYSPARAIPMHSEQSYTCSWPLILGFWCVEAASTGGGTPLASTAQVLAALPSALVGRFDRHGVMYERWYRQHLGISWQETFQTDSVAAVDEICAEMGITSEWHDGNVLRTTQIAQATVAYPPTGQRVWFNQANLFHVAALQAAVAQELEQAVGGRMPRSARFGDGRPIASADIEAIEEAFRAANWCSPWRDGDVLLVDNIAVAHGREAFGGSRRVLVAMAGRGGEPAKGAS